MDNLLHVHIPKTGGWSLQTTLLDYGVKKFQYGHRYASDIKDELGEEFDNKFKFTIVRNPWARLLSSYTFCTKGSEIHRPPEHIVFDQLKVNSFEEFIYKLVDINKDKDDVYITPKGNVDISELVKNANGLTLNQTNWVLDKNGNRLVDYVGYLHDLENSIKELNSLTDMKLPVPPKGNVTQHVKYTEAYTDETRDMVAKLYEKDIKEFGFKFGE